jgi:hypothetical protein
MNVKVKLWTKKIHIPVITFEQGMHDIDVYLKTMIPKLSDKVEFNESMSLPHNVDGYTMVYNILVQQHSYALPVYNRHTEYVKEYIAAVTLPRLDTTDDAQFAAAFIWAWRNFKLFNQWMSF